MSLGSGALVGPWVLIRSVPEKCRYGRGQAVSTLARFSGGMGF